MGTLKIKWERLVSGGQTCSRCSSTEKELEKAVSIFRKVLPSAGIEVMLEKDELSVDEFKKDPLRSNRIWINDKLLEKWIGGNVGKSPCCDVCGPVECRTICVGGDVYETIPAELIIKAVLIAVSIMIVKETDESSCESKTPKTPTTGCCSR